MMNRIRSVVAVLLLVACPVFAEEAQPDYFALVRAYADTMIEHGRDTYGEAHSPLFAGALDRNTLKISPDFPPIPGIRNKDRCLTGSNPHIEQGLYHALYRLTELTGDKRYAEQADAALQFFFKTCQNKHGLPPWGEHLLWDFYLEAPRASSTDPRDARKLIHEPGAWAFRDEAARLAPDAYYRYAIALWECQIGNKETGDYSRHANFSRGSGGQGAAYPRLAGQMIEVWAHAYAYPAFQDKPDRDKLLRAIKLITQRMRTNREAVGDARVLPYANPSSVRGGIKPGREYDPAPEAWLDSNLELARGLLSGAEHIAPPTSKLMEEVALTQHEDFLRQPHFEDGNDLLRTVSTGAAKDNRKKPEKKGGMWFSAYGGAGGFSGYLTRKMAVAYQTIRDEHPALAQQYKRLLIKDSEQYLKQAPDLDKAKQINLKPSVYATLIELMLHMHEITGEKQYLERADFFAQQAVELFLGGVDGPGAALPRSSTQTDHYESITGGPELMWALLQLHERLQK